MTGIIEQPTSRETCSELVWDSETHATATAGRLTLPTGETDDWTPAILLATAAGASLWTTFARLASAAGVPVLAYAARHEAMLSGDRTHIMAIAISPCITVASERAAEQARALWSRALDRAPVLRTLDCPLTCEPHIVVLADSGAVVREG